jgi:hypothetical protein
VAAVLQLHEAVVRLGVAQVRERERVAVAPVGGAIADAALSGARLAAEADARVAAGQGLVAGLIAGGALARRAAEAAAGAVPAADAAGLGARDAGRATRKRARAVLAPGLALFRTGRARLRARVLRCAVVRAEKAPRALVGARRVKALAATAAASGAARHCAVAAERRAVVAAGKLLSAALGARLRGRRAAARALHLVPARAARHDLVDEHRARSGARLPARERAGVLAAPERRPGAGRLADGLGGNDVALQRRLVAAGKLALHGNAARAAVAEARQDACVAADARARARLGAAQAVVAVRVAALRADLQRKRVRGMERENCVVREMC